MKLSRATPFPQKADTSLLKYFLGLIALFFAISATLLSIFFTSAATTTGSSPDYAISFSQNMSTGILGPGEQRWFKITPNPHGDTFQASNFSLFFTGNGDNVRHRVNFELFSMAEVQAWQRGDKDKLANFGAGMAISRDNDPHVGERVWHGVLLKDQDYYLAVENGADAVVDYWLYNQDIIALPSSTVANNVPATEPKMVNAVPDVVQSVSPQTALPLVQERMQGALAPGQESWYSFSIDNDPSQAFEPMAFTMIATPNDTNQAQHVTFDVFTADNVKDWSMDNKDGVNNVGAGSVVVRDDNPLTAERFWSGWVVSGDLYYLRVRNGADIPVDYWLFSGDVYGPELGTP